MNDRTAITLYDAIMHCKKHKIKLTKRLKAAVRYFKIGLKIHPKFYSNVTVRSALRQRKRHSIT